MKIARTVKNIATAKLLNQKRPLNVSFFITNKCDLRCSYCNIPQTRGHHAQMTTDEIKGMLDAYFDLGMVKFSCSGGEPLLRPDLGEIISHASDLGVVTSITTNGRLLPKRAETLGALDTMLISLDGDTLHQKSTKTNDPESVIHGIKLMKEMHDTNVWLSTVLIEHTRDQLDYLISVCKDLDVKVLLQPFHDVLAEGMEFGRKLDDEPLKDIFRYVLDREPGIVANSPDYIDLVMKDKSLHPSFCLAGVRTCFIDSNGDVFPCLPILMGARPTKNGLRDGWGAAFDDMPTATCGTCRYPNQSEIYFTFDMKPRTWMHLAKNV